MEQVVYEGGVGAAPDRVLHGLRDAARRHAVRPGDREQPGADQAQSARSQGRGRGGDGRGPARRDQRDRRRAGAARRPRRRHAGDERGVWRAIQDARAHGKGLAQGGPDGEDARRRGPGPDPSQGPHPERLARHAGERRPAPGNLRHHADRADQRQLLSGPDRVPAHRRGEGPAPARAESRERRQDEGGAGHRHHRLRHAVLRAAAEALPAPARDEGQLRERTRASPRSPPSATARSRAPTS